MQYYDTYKSTEKKEPFASWIGKTGDINIDHNLLAKLIDMFNINNIENTTLYYDCKHNYSKTISKNNLCELLKEEGFLFPCKQLKT
jgi:hypothetical protein